MADDPQSMERVNHEHSGISQSMAASPPSSQSDLNHPQTTSTTKSRTTRSLKRVNKGLPPPISLDDIDSMILHELKDLHNTSIPQGSTLDTIIKPMISSSQPTSLDPKMIEIMNARSQISSPRSSMRIQSRKDEIAKDLQGLGDIYNFDSASDDDETHRM